ncbi:MAG: universal stress protein [Candidatus Promineifilaceae bacterium]|nr:universal stress protein [Candidatus Promineifilaceae bacterium]
MERESPQFLAAMRDFRRARQRAFLERILARIKRHSADLLDYDEVHEKLQAGQALEQRLETVPLDAIVGSVGRYTDFTRTFLPRHRSSQTRWAAVKAALPEIEAFPPITVYQIDQAYFVLDGNHRVSIARQAGAKQIKAYVTPIATRVPLAPDMEPDDLIRQENYALFLETTGLDESRPKADFTVTEPGQYGVLLEQISAHQVQTLARESLSFRQAAARWHDDVYAPIIALIRQQRILRHFPKRTETDLYAWIARHQERLKGALGWEAPTEAVANELVARYSPSPQQFLARVKGRIRAALTPEPLEAGPPPGQWRQEHRQSRQLFHEILVPLSGAETGHRTLDQALIFARREGSRLHGLHVTNPEEQSSQAAAAAIEAEFWARCTAADVSCDMAQAAGELLDELLQRARWADLVIYSIAHPPYEQPLGRLNSDFNGLIRQSPRPTLVVPGASAPMNAALLAYDGSPKANEALFVAAYLAGRWSIPLTVVSVNEAGRPAESPLDAAQSYLAERQVQATLIAESGAAAEAIERAATTHQCDFIIMGGYGFGPLLEVVMGSTVDKILRLRHWPVLICR